MQERIMKKLYTLLLILCSVAVSAQSVIYVNSTTGDNAFDGLSATVSGMVGPKRTFGGNDGALANAAAGDIISVETGAYEENVVINHNITLVKTGTEHVHISSLTFTNGAMLNQPLPTGSAFFVPLVTINNGSSVVDGATLVGANGTLVLNAGTYNQSLFLEKSFNLLAVGNPEVQDVILSGNGVVVVLEGALGVSNSLQFNRPEGGKLEISSGQLTVLPGAMMTPGTGNSYAVTTGSGKLVSNVASAGTVFPIGIATAYTPVTISGVTSGTDEAVSASVRTAGNMGSFNPDLPLQVNSHVRLVWSISSNIQSNATIRFDYNGSFEPADWNSVQNRVVARALSQTYENGTNSVIGESFASADFSSVKGTFAVYSDFPNAIPYNESVIAASAFPNPFNSTLQVSLNGSVNEIVNLRITDLAGRVISTESITLDNAQSVYLVNTSILHESGLYLLTIEGKYATSTLRVVKN
jgi:hypothetical protein